MSFGAGGMHVVLGANGTGKTTLLRTVLGVQAPLAGHITLDEGAGSLNANDHRAWEKHVAFVPSMPPKDVGLTVAEVLSLSGPWQRKQLFERIGRISRLNRTVLGSSSAASGSNRKLIKIEANTVRLSDITL